MRPTVSHYIQAVTKIVTYAYPDAAEIYALVKTGGSLFEVIADSNFQIVGRYLKLRSSTTVLGLASW